MSKRPYNSQAPAAASDGLVERLKAAGNDAVFLREIVESSDSGSIAAAFATLLAGGTASTPSGSKLRRKAHNRPCPSLPAETFVEVVLFADRNTLDTMQLVCSFLLNFIRERELTLLALRAIPKVTIGCCRNYARGHFECWLPLVETVRDHGDGRELVPKSVYHLTSFLRMAFCEAVEIHLVGGPDEGPAFNAMCGMLFHDLASPTTFVGTLTISQFLRNADAVARGIEAFKSVKSVSADGWYEDVEPLGDDFFGAAAGRGVRNINIEIKSQDGDVAMANTASALSFGFADPAAGGDRSVLGVTCDGGADFLAQFKQKVAEMDEARHVDFTFKLANVSKHIASAGFEKYQVDDGRTWLMKDLDNHFNVEVKQTENLVEIHVFSSV